MKSTLSQQVLLTFVDCRTHCGVATISINRARSGNALNGALVEQLRFVLGRAVESQDVGAIVIAAAGKTFMSGADVGYFSRCLEAHNLAGIAEFTRSVQDLFAQIAACPKPVVAAVNGAALGGGLELALACHQIVATPRASFAFPETGLGIVPAAGGTFRAPRRLGLEAARWLVYTGYLVSPPRAVELGLVDQLVMPHALASAATHCAQALASGSRSERLTRQPQADIAPLLSLFRRARVAELHAAPAPNNRVLAAAQKAIVARPLPALEWAETLLDRSLDTTPAEAGSAALTATLDLFGRTDARQRLAQAAARQRPATA